MQGNRRNSSRVLLTLEALNLKSTLYPCADNLMLRDAKNDLTVLDVDAVHLADTGNFTASKAKAYLCQHQTDVRFSIFFYFLSTISFLVPFIQLEIGFDGLRRTTGRARCASCRRRRR